MPLARKHLQGCTLLLDRTELLRHMPKNAVCAEIGVDEGNFSEEILQITSPRKLYLMDLWGTERFGESKQAAVMTRFNNLIAGGQVVVTRGNSVELLQTFSSGIFSWVYLDTSHTFEQTKLELETLHTRVVDGGFICGHDYTQGNVKTGVTYGVIPAVNNFCIEHGYRFAYLTHEQHRFLSFAIQKIPDGELK